MTCSRQCIVLIEDHETLRAMLEQAFRREGYEAYSAGDGRAGVALVRVQQPDLLVCDYRLPGLSALGVIQALQAEAATRAIPVVILTAQPAGEVRRWLAEAGFEGVPVLEKGRDPLFAHIRQLLGTSTASS